MSSLSWPVGTSNNKTTRLRRPLRQSSSCGAHWRAGPLVWPPYAGVWGPGCQRCSSTWRAVGGHMGWGFWVGNGGGGQPLHQHCTRRTRAEQHPAGEWGAFSKERSTGAPFSHSPLTLPCSASPPLPPFSPPCSTPSHGGPMH